jgi:hypothetical protein
MNVYSVTPISIGVAVTGTGAQITMEKKLLIKPSKNSYIQATSGKTHIYPTQY